MLIMLALGETGGDLTSRIRDKKLPKLIWQKQNSSDYARPQLRGCGIPSPPAPPSPTAISGAHSDHHVLPQLEMEKAFVR
jgi:hypothetical protein